MAVTTVKADLPAEIFDVQTNVPLIHQVVVAQLAAARQGTHSTKTRGEVRGGGAKPYRQKGTGRARQGSTRAPQFTGGGVVHGPTPRDYSQRTPKKMKAAALRGALSDRARHDRVHVIDALVSGDVPSAKQAWAGLSGLTSRPNLLLVLERGDEVSWKSARNLEGVHVLAADQLNTYDVLCADDVVFTQGAFDAFVTAATKGTEKWSIHIKDPRDILIAPVVSEKSYGLLDEGKYTFLVDPRSNKTEIKIAIEQVFNVKVDSVHTMNRKGKSRRTRFGVGKRKDTKRAIVTLREGSIDIFGAGA